MTTISRRARRGLATLTILLAVAVTAAACDPVPPTGPPPTPPADKVEPAVRAAVAGGGQATFWVRFADTTDLPGPKRWPSWAAQGQAVVDALSHTADASQAAAVAKLNELGVHYRRFWITNAMVVTGDESVVDAMAADPAVATIAAPKTLSVAEPTPAPPVDTGRSEPGVEWGVDADHAPTIWDQRQAQGEHIVVGSIDTGVQFDHPALAARYRSPYGWYDPTGVCPAATPCDNVGHGTHMMGTMVGASANDRIGVAPGAQGMAAKGCRDTHCSDADLVAAAQWMLAPTQGSPDDVSGALPEFRPHVIANGWTGDHRDPWFRDVVRAWNAAGIFSTFAAGDGGPACGSAASPADDPDAFVVGAYGPDGRIADFSGRGGSPVDGDTKPDIAAPGVAIRSSVPGGYATYSGTAMAAAHVAGAVALMWSAAPWLTGFVEQTRLIIERGAGDQADTSCGSTAADNAVWGEGQLDIPAALEQMNHLSGPRIDLRTPTVQATYALNAVVKADYSCTDADDPHPSCVGSVPSGTPIDTSTAGPHRFRVEASDRIGFGASEEIGYTVLACDGKAPTIVGGPGDDSIRGTSGNDVILDLGGDNRVAAGAGDDVICLGPGNDTVDAGEGDNTIDAGDGTNAVTAGGGDDAIVTGDGDDVVSAGGGANFVETAGGADKVTTLDGADTISTADGDDTVDAGDGPNKVILGRGDDTATTGPGPDLVDGGGGNDGCTSGAGADRLLRCEG